MDISLDKVGFVILRARELGVKVGRWDSPADEADADSILESRPSDATGHELLSFLRDLNNDEKAALVAIAWLGRDDSFDDYSDAFEMAKSEQSAPTERYLLGMPLLADYLESGLERLGINATAVEDDLYRKA